MGTARSSGTCSECGGRSWDRGCVRIFAVRTRHDVYRSVGDRRIVNGDPHGGAFKRIGYFEVGVVLVPVGARSVAAWFEKHLVWVQYGRCANQLSDRFANARNKGQSANEVAFVMQRDKLQFARSVEGVWPSPSVATLRTRPSRLKRSTSFAAPLLRARRKSGERTCSLPVKLGNVLVV